MNHDKNFLRPPTSNSDQKKRSGFKLVRHTYESNLLMPRHVHDFSYISFVLCGGYEEKIGGRTRERVPQTVVFHPPQEGHAVRFFDAQTRILQINVESFYIDRCDFFGRVFEESFSVRKQVVNRIATRLYGEFRKNDEFSDLAIQGLMLELAAEVGRYRSERKSRETCPPWLARTKEILCDERGTNKSLEEIAKEIDVHPVYLSREFRRLTGCTVGEFVRRQRIERACRTLSRTDKKLSEIAVEIGFYDQSHFTNAFKRVTGITPAEYRANFR